MFGKAKRQSEKNTAAQRLSKVPRATLLSVWNSTSVEFWSIGLQHEQDRGEKNWGTNIYLKICRRCAAQCYVAGLALLFLFIYLFPWFIWKRHDISTALRSLQLIKFCTLWLSCTLICCTLSPRGTLFQPIPTLYSFMNASRIVFLEQTVNLQGFAQDLLIKSIITLILASIWNEIQRKKKRLSRKSFCIFF